MSLWLRRSHKDHSYWDIASANFKHAIGLSCELVVEHIQSFIHSGICSTRAALTESSFSRQHCCLKVPSKDQCVILVLEIIKIELHGHCQPYARDMKHRFDPWIGKILWRKAWQSTPVFLPVLLGQRSWAVHGVTKSWTQFSTHAKGKTPNKV